jgi:hypothetical protein
MLNVELPVEEISLLNVNLNVQPRLFKPGCSMYELEC